MNDDNGSVRHPEPGFYGTAEPTAMTDAATSPQSLLPCICGNTELVLMWHERERESHGLNYPSIWEARYACAGKGHLLHFGWCYFGLGPEKGDPNVIEAARVGWNEAVAALTRAPAEELVGTMAVPTYDKCDTYVAGQYVFNYLRTFLAAAGIDASKCRLVIELPDRDTQRQLVSVLQQEAKGSPRSAARVGNHSGIWQGVEYEFALRDSQIPDIGELREALPRIRFYLNEASFAASFTEPGQVEMRDLRDTIDRYLAKLETQKGERECEHDWHYNGTDRGGSHKGEDAYKCHKCGKREYRQ